MAGPCSGLPHQEGAFYKVGPQMVNESATFDLLVKIIVYYAACRLIMSIKDV